MVLPRTKLGTSVSFPNLRIQVSSVIHALRNAYVANQLRRAHEAKTGVKYTHVIRLRPDMLLWEPFPVEVSWWEYFFLQ